MGPRSIATFAVGATVGATACAALASGTASGVSPDRAGGGLGPRLGAARRVAVPAAAEADLPAFDDCEQLRRWYVRAALPRVGPWGLDGPPVMFALDTRRDIVPAAGAAGPIGSSATGTNVQEAAVDESDVAKTDGSVVVRVVGRTLVVTDVTGDRPLVLSRTPLPGPLLDRPEVLLRDGRVVVVGAERATPYAVAPGKVRLVPRPGFVPPWLTSRRTRLVSVDVTDPVAPRVVGSRTIDGTAVSARQYADGAVRVVVATRHPELPFVSAGPRRTAPQATAANRKVVRAAPVEAWLPEITSTAPGEEAALGCSDVRHPGRPPGWDAHRAHPRHRRRPGRHRGHDVRRPRLLLLRPVVRRHVDRPAPARCTSSRSTGAAPPTSAPGPSRAPSRTAGPSTSTTGTCGWPSPWATRGSPGRTPSSCSPSATGASCETGTLAGLGRKEQIRSVRWLGDLAVVVTFRQTDPVHTVDLSDPDRPRLVGELRIPGYSAYLHPVGGDLLVGLGQAVTPDGADRGAQVATFDLSDPTDVRRTDTVGLGRGTGLGIETDAHAFTYLADQRTFVTSVQRWSSIRPQLVAVRVDADGTLTRTASWTMHAGDGSRVRALPLGGGRVALVDDRVRVVRVG